MREFKVLKRFGVTVDGGKTIVLQQGDLVNLQSNWGQATYEFDVKKSKTAARGTTFVLSANDRRLQSISLPQKEQV